MTRNDTFFKCLFAIELALLPLVMAAYLMLPTWTVGIFIAGVLIVKIWMELFKNKNSRTHNIILTIGNILTICSLVIFFTVYEYINLAMCIVVVSFVVLRNLFKLMGQNEVYPEIIDAVDSCYVLFECLTFATLTFVVFYQLATNIALFSLVLTAAVSVAYKIYHIVRYKDVISKIKNLFRRK